MKKLMLVPYFGDYPEWIDKYKENIKLLEPYGYDWLFFDDLDEFSKRIVALFGRTPDIKPGTSASHNFRTAFGLLFEKELTGYDFWGITDLDCVYGRVDHFVPDILLKTLDIQSNHHNYICGPWTLFRNIEKINNLFMKVPNWENLMFDTRSHPGRWTEVEYSQIVDQENEAGNLKRVYTFHQGKDPNVWGNISFHDGQLWDDNQEIMMFHFNRHKIYPL